ncbi:bZIP transcription factor 60-like isoform X2 [Oryza sativa Japonica Group]|uniref:bZIP transcription factor 60-like isoform X2 n=1 Tax=Oryza sativa subsp. japonica TaxID=39947 RepID=UPI00339D268D
MAEQLGGVGSPQLSLSSCSSFLSISSAGTSAADGAPHLSLGVGGAEELDLLLQVGIGGGGGGGGDEEEEERKTIRMMKNRESALRSRARKRLKTEMAALIQQPTNKQSSHRRSSST